MKNKKIYVAIIKEFNWDDGREEYYYGAVFLNEEDALSIIELEIKKWLKNNGLDTTKDFDINNYGITNFYTYNLIGWEIKETFLEQNFVNN